MVIAAGGDLPRLEERPRGDPAAVALGHAMQLERAVGEHEVEHALGSIRVGQHDEEALVRTLARQLKLPIAWLRGKWVEREVLELVPAETVP